MDFVPNREKFNRIPNTRLVPCHQREAHPGHCINLPQAAAVKRRGNGGRTLYISGRIGIDRAIGRAGRH